MTRYLTLCFCPCCKIVFEAIKHKDPEPHAQSLAMMVQPIRQAHATRSPDCTKPKEWLEGWKQETHKLEVVFEDG